MKNSPPSSDSRKPLAPLGVDGEAGRELGQIRVDLALRERAAEALVPGPESGVEKRGPDPDPRCRHDPIMAVRVSKSSEALELLAGEVSQSAR